MCPSYVVQHHLLLIGAVRACRRYPAGSSSWAVPEEAVLPGWQDPVAGIWSDLLFAHRS